MEELMQKDLLSKLLSNNTIVTTEYIRSHKFYSSKIETNKPVQKYLWRITSQDTGKTISESLLKSYSRMLFEITRLINNIDDLFVINCKYSVENKKLLTELEIKLEEKSDGYSWTWIYHKVKSEESAELLLIQAKKFIVDELTKMKESIS